MSLPTPEQERWRLALEGASFGVWDLDPRAEQVHYSPAWKARLGLVPVDAPDSTAFWRERVHPDDLAPMLGALRAHVDGDTPDYEMQFRLRGGGAGWRTVLSRGRVVERDDRGEALRVVGTMIELSGRPSRPGSGPAERVRRSRLSHDLRTPLHAILGLSYLLSQRVGEAPADEQRRQLAAIEEAGRHLLERVDDLLDMAVRDGSPDTRRLR
ncbi:MAG: PAS domain-containing protein [Piscinibacter sp.]|uniref:PAS domain-containing protein n=1 Tax=Piscinibacter sp. TaxID=1903157 RepID=UPI0025855AA2|nr:PAS domain-containing protein [Piscinibacter sp.]MCW5665300.1 PAS domain-containing protein [Piscinibacter sp.]